VFHYSLHPLKFKLVGFHLCVCGFFLKDLCLQNLWFISVKKLVTFDHVVGVFFPWKFKLILRILNWSPKRKKKFVVQPVSVEKSVEGVIMDSKG